MRVALPSGELEKDVLRFLKVIGFSIPEREKTLLLPITNAPIDLVITRASDVPRLVTDERSTIKAGITGSDIIWESRLGKDNGFMLPIQEFFPKPTTPSLFIGITEPFARKIQTEEFREVKITDLQNKMVVTKFPNIATELLAERNVQCVEIFPSPGKTEAWQYIFSDCVGIVDIVDSGETIQANDILLLEKFYEVTIRMIEASEKLSRREQTILNDLKEQITVAIQRRRML
jgi:ATP phosphoribosyltransferase